MTPFKGLANTPVRINHTFTGMSVPEHRFRIGSKPFHVVHGWGPADTAHALSGGGWCKTRDRWSCSKRVLLALMLGLGHNLVRVYPVPGTLGWGVIQRPRYWSGAMAGGDKCTGVIGIGGAAALTGCGNLVVARCHWAIAVARGVHHDGIRVFLGQRLLANTQKR